MNEEALNDSFLLFKNAGYGGSIQDYVTLLKTNKDALKDSYKLFAGAGYGGEIDHFT